VFAGPEERPANVIARVRSAIDPTLAEVAWGAVSVRGGLAGWQPCEVSASKAVCAS